MCKLPYLATEFQVKTARKSGFLAQKKPSKFYYFKVKLICLKLEKILTYRRKFN
jgi:hypothetical protein